MCGIAATWRDGDPARVRSMMDRLAHRGPDAEGVYGGPEDEILLGHRRLAIIDPERGDQPIPGLDGSAAIVANGEIYNHEALRCRLVDGAPLRTRSDSEVILRLYQTRGRDAVRERSGSFHPEAGSGPGAGSSASTGSPRVGARIIRRRG